MVENILIFEAHSDDAVIGMGGYIIRYQSVYNFILVTMTAGETAYTIVDQKGKMKEIREKESLAADEVLRIKKHIFLANPCQDMQNNLTNYHKVVEIIRKYKPIKIFTHKSPSKHRDHRNVHDVVEEGWWKASERVLADLGEPYRAPALYFFEVTDTFEFPEFIVDISDVFDKKLEALARFESQFDVLPGMDRYVKGLGMVRGYQAGVKYGEAFVQSRLMPEIL